MEIGSPFVHGVGRIGVWDELNHCGAASKYPSALGFLGETRVVFRPKNACGATR